jgi:hypothetical protein
MSLLKLWFIRNPVLVSYIICVRQGSSNLSGSQSALTCLCVYARVQLGLREFNRYASESALNVSGTIDSPPWRKWPIRSHHSPSETRVRGSILHESKDCVHHSRVVSRTEKIPTWTRLHWSMRRLETLKPARRRLRLKDFSALSPFATCLS